MKIILGIIAACLLFSSQAQAHRAQHHYRHQATENRSGLSHEKLADGQTIVVASAYASRFVGFFNALYRREGRLPSIDCFSATGHMRNSLHHWGGACDAGQRRRNVADRMMYHVADLAAEYGLTDGCSWHYRDCGHVDVSGVVSVRRDTRYAERRHRYYAAVKPEPVANYPFDRAARAVYTKAAMHADTW